MAVKHLFLGQALGAGGHDIVFLDLVQKTVLGQQRQRRKGRDGRGRDRQRNVPEIISHFAQQRQFVEIVRGQAAQREYLEIRPARKQDQQQDRKQKTGDGIGNDDHARSPCIKGRAILDSLADTQRDRHRIGNKRGPQAQRDRDGHFLQHQINHADRAKIAVPEVQPNVIPQHREEALQRRFVETELALKLGDELGRQAPRAGIFAVRSGTGTDARIPATGKTLEHIALTLHLRDDLLDGTARHELHQREIDHHDPQQCRDDQRQTAEDIGAHVSAPSGSRQRPEGPAPSRG